MNLDQFQPLGNFYRVRFVEPEAESAGGIALPETVLPAVQSAIVLGYGEGRVLNSGARHPMHCEIGDLVIAKPYDFERVSETEAFLADDRIVAFQPWCSGSDADTGTEGHGPLEAANDWVLVQPDAAKAVDPITGASVVKGEGQVLVVAAAVKGGESREIERGRELVKQAEAITRSQRFREAPNRYEKDRILHDFFDGFCHWEHIAFQQALNETPDNPLRQRAPMRPMHRATAGTVVSVGPGKPWGADEDGKAFCYDRSIWYGDPYTCENLFPGDRVHFDRNYQAVALFTEAGSLWALKSSDLAAVECE